MSNQVKMNNKKENKESESRKMVNEIGVIGKGDKSSERESEKRVNQDSIKRKI